MPNKDLIEAHAAKHQINFESYKQLLSDSEITQLVGKEIDRLQDQFARFEQIRAFRLLDRPLTIQDGELTPTLKIKGKIVEEKYADLI